MAFKERAKALTSIGWSAFVFLWGVMNKIEEIKKERDGLEVLQDVPRYTQEGWEAITEGDRERLKWTGVFFVGRLRATS